MLTDQNPHAARTATSVDLTNCDREPIRIPGSIQPHGLLFVLDEQDLAIRQVSENVGPRFGLATEELLHRPLAQFLDRDLCEQIRRDVGAVPLQQRPVFLRSLQLGPKNDPHVFNVVAHRTEAGIVLELEAALHDAAAPPLSALLEGFSHQVEATHSIADLSRVTAQAVRRLTGFDRVLVYGFDEDAHGTVVGEDGNGRLPSLLDHRFPASDIPQQARELYRSNRLRLIPDSTYQPVPIVPAVNPATNQPLDLTFSTLRSVSPIHVEYMRNMETASSMSISILRAGRLWGLISCHHREPKSAAFEVRSLCDLYARIFSLRLSALEISQDYERRTEVRSAYSKLLAALAAHGDVSVALTEQGKNLLSFGEAGGAAILNDGRCTLLGRTPPEAFVHELATWLFQEPRPEVYAVDALPHVFAPAETFQDCASGLLAIAISKLYPSYVLWFRPEVVQTVKWSGDPRKPVAAESNDQKIHPRRSFETWKETVRGKSAPWKASELEGAHDLRNAVVGIVLRKAEELAELNAELTRSNKELESFSYSVSHDLRAPLRHIVGYAEMLKDAAAAQLSAKAERCVNTIIESSEYAGKLVDKLLAYSRMGRAELQLTRVDMNVLFQETVRDVVREHRDREIQWQIASLPIVDADLIMLREAVRNLLENAVKFTRSRAPAVIEVNSAEQDGEFVFSVRDNGVGFDQQYAGKLFGVFQRLHRIEDYQGTGIGLANVRRVMERHGGRTWAEGVEGAGATFYFTLPKSRP